MINFQIYKTRIKPINPQKPALIKPVKPAGLGFMIKPGFYANPAADPGVASMIPAQSHTFVEFDHEIISTAILLPSADSRRVVVSYKRKRVHEELVKRLFKLAQEKSVVR